MAPHRHPRRPDPESRSARASRIPRAPYALPPGVPALQDDPRLRRGRLLGVILAVCAVSLAAGFGVGRTAPGAGAGAPHAQLFVEQPDLLSERLADPRVRHGFEQLALDAIVRPGEPARRFAQALLDQLERAGLPEGYGALGVALRARVETD